MEDERSSILVVMIMIIMIMFPKYSASFIASGVSTRLISSILFLTCKLYNQPVYVVGYIVYMLEIE